MDILNIFNTPQARKAHFEEHRTFFAATYLQTLRHELAQRKLYVHRTGELDEPVLIREVLNPDCDGDCVWVIHVGSRGWLSVWTCINPDAEPSFSVEFAERKVLKGLFSVNITWPKGATEPAMTLVHSCAAMKETLSWLTEISSFQGCTHLIVDEIERFCKAK